MKVRIVEEGFPAIFRKQILTKGGPPKKIVPCCLTIMLSSAIAGT